MIRMIAALFFLISFNFSQAQVNHFDKKNSNKKQKNSIQEDITQQKIVVWLSYEVGSDSVATNITYVPRPNLPVPRDNMIAEAIRVVSQMKISPQRDSTGKIINNKGYSKIAFTPKKEKED